MPATAICADLRAKLSIPWPGIRKDVTTLVTARMAASGTRSNVASSRSR